MINNTQKGKEMKKEITNLFKNAKFIAGANLAALLFSGSVAAKDLSDKECQEQFNGKAIITGDFPGDKGCDCDNVADVIDAEAGNVYYSVLGNCRAMTAEEKAFIDLRNNQDYDCIGECQQGQKLIDCIKDKNCQTLANRKCANVDVPTADNGLSYEEYYNILKKAKKCQAPADKLIKQVIKSQGR